MFLTSRFLKFSITLIFLVFSGYDLFSQKTFSLNVADTEKLPLYDLTIENFAESGSYQDDMDSYITITLNKTLKGSEDPQVIIQSSHEEIILTQAKTISDSIKIFYNHRDSTFSFQLDFDLESSLCTRSYQYSYEFINSRPVMGFQKFSVPENSNEGTLIGKIIATDNEEDQLQYEILTASSGSEAFSVDKNTGSIAIVDSSFFDHESRELVELLIEVSDGRLTKDQVIEIEIKDINEHPVIEYAEFEVSNETSVGSTLGFIEAEDPEEDRLIYKIIDGNVDDLFELDSLTGELKYVNTLANDAEMNYSLLVEATDGELSDEENIDVLVKVITSANSSLETIRIFPNPARTNVQIEGGQVKIHSVFLTDISGKKYQVDLKDNQINLKSFSPGTYILHVTTDNEILKYKIIKE